MFKKFSVKEDVSGSTSIKSSVQRNIRNQLLVQLPFLAQPAYRENTSDQAAPSADTASSKGHQGDVPALEDEPAQVDEDAEEDEDAGGKKGKKGGKGGKGGKGKGGKKSKEEKGSSKKKGGGKDDDEEEEGGAEDAELTVLDEIWPKKEPLGWTKCHDRISIYTVQSTPLWFNHFDGPFIPTLKLLHKYPHMLPHVQIDRGAIKFLLAGANMMAPGFLSPGGRLPEGLAQDQIVAIHAEGKEHACGIGKMMSSSEDIRKAGKGVAVEVVCWIGDDLWKIDTIGL